MSKKQYMIKKTIANACPGEEGGHSQRTGRKKTSEGEKKKSEAPNP